MKSEILISVIIPAYNAESVLKRAVESITIPKQSSNRVEILIIENGSTDSTALVASELEQQYDCVHFLHSDKGVSKARNRGIEAATGKWIMFVDADDYLAADSFSIVINDALNSRFDLLLYGHEAGSKSNKVLPGESRMVFKNDSVEKCRIMMIENPTRYMQVWAKLFKKELIVENNIRFNETMCFSEDSDFTLRYSKYCNDICLCPEIVYHYSLDNASTMRMYDGKKVKGYISAMKETQKSLERENDQIHKAFEKYVLMHLNIALVREVFCLENPMSFFEKIKQMKPVIREDVFDNAIQNVHIKEGISLRMIPVFLLKYHFYVLAGLVYVVRARQNYIKEH